MSSAGYLPKYSIHTEYRIFIDLMSRLAVRTTNQFTSSNWEDNLGRAPFHRGSKPFFLSFSFPFVFVFLFTVRGTESHSLGTGMGSETRKKASKCGHFGLVARFEQVDDEEHHFSGLLRLHHRSDADLAAMMSSGGLVRLFRQKGKRSKNKQHAYP